MNNNRIGALLPHQGLDYIDTRSIVRNHDRTRKNCSICVSSVAAVALAIFLIIRNFHEQQAIVSKTPARYHVTVTSDGRGYGTLLNQEEIEDLQTRVKINFFVLGPLVACLAAVAAYALCFNIFQSRLRVENKLALPDNLKTERLNKRDIQQLARLISCNCKEILVRKMDFEQLFYTRQVLSHDDFFKLYTVIVEPKWVQIAAFLKNRIYETDGFASLVQNRYHVYEALRIDEGEHKAKILPCANSFLASKWRPDLVIQLSNVKLNDFVIEIDLKLLQAASRFFSENASGMKLLSIQDRLSSFTPETPTDKEAYFEFLRICANPNKKIDLEGALSALPFADQFLCEDLASWLAQMIVVEADSIENLHECLMEYPRWFKAPMEYRLKHMQISREDCEPVYNFAKAIADTSLVTRCLQIVLKELSMITTEEALTQELNKPWIYPLLSLILNETKGWNEFYEKMKTIIQPGNIAFLHRFALHNHLHKLANLCKVNDAKHAARPHASKPPVRRRGV
jgi:hypothetical protein